MATNEVNEDSTAELTVTFLDAQGLPATPSSAALRIDCLTTGTAIQAETALSVASTVTITLGPSRTVIVNEKNAQERRLVTIRAVYGDDDAIVEQFEYFVKNLSKR